MTRQRFTKDWEHLSHTLGYKTKYEMLSDLYITKELSLNEIGERIGCSPHAVGRNLAKLGIERRSRGGDNNIGSQTRKLFRLDQRVVLYAPFLQTTHLTFVSTSLLYKFRRLMEGKHELLHHHPDSGFGEIRDAQ